MKHVLIAALTALGFACASAGGVMAGGPLAPAPSGYHLAGGISNLFDGIGGDRGRTKDGQHPIRDEQTFAEMTTTHTIVPFQRADLYFTINLPKDWSADLLPEGTREATRIIGDIARFSSPMIGTQRLRLSVQAVSVEHEISMQNWLRHYILANGFAPDGNVIVDPKNPRRTSINFVSIEGGQSVYNYMAAQLSGNIVMLARFQAPQSLKDYVQFLQKRTIDSFSLTYPKEGPIERHRAFMMMDALKMSIPESWETAGQNFKDMNRLSVQLLNKSVTGSVDGFILIQAIRRHRSTSLLKEAEALREFFDARLNLDITDMVSSGESVAGNRFIFNRYEVYNVESRRRGQSKQDTHLVVLGDREWYIFITMLTMREEERLYAWARNVQTLEEIVRSIR